MHTDAVYNGLFAKNAGCTRLSQTRCFRGRPENLAEKIERLPPGDYMEGLLAVRLHVDVAARHFQRGLKNIDETAFTDAVYRCNQAFEGSIKEAYRVLTRDNPERKTPAEIEDFLTAGNILRKRVLLQFTAYRRNWRNPSTHDYKLDFDEDEALLAIVSVAVFAIVLCDQVADRVAFNLAELQAKSTTASVDATGSLLSLVAVQVQRFASELSRAAPDKHQSEIGHQQMDVYQQLKAALGGFLSATFSTSEDLQVLINSPFSPDTDIEADIIVQGLDGKIIVETKYMQLFYPPKFVVERSVRPALTYLEFKGVIGIIFLSVHPQGYEYTINLSDSVGSRLNVIAPEKHVGL